MQNLLRIGTALAVVLGIVCVTLWRDLRAERQLTAGLSAQVAGLTARNAAIPQALRVDVRPVAAKNDSRSAQSPPPKPVPDAPISVIPRNIMSPERNLMSDPEYRKARLAQAKMTLKRNYTDVGEELGLSEKETEQLFDMLAEQQLGPGMPLPIGADGQPDRQAMEEAVRMRQVTQRKQEEALLALLGPEREPKWREYQQSLSARSRATQMSSMLAASGAALTEAQLRPLTAALIAEEKFVRQEQSTTHALPMTGQSAAQRQEEAVKRDEDSNRRYLEAAAGYMSARQLALVKDVLDQQIAIRRASVRLQRERMETTTNRF